MMTQMTSFSQMPPFGQDSVAVQPADDSAATVRLKRVGARPLVFAGQELCMAMSYIPGAPLWFEINVWQISSGTFVTAVKQFHRDEDKSDTCRAWESSDFDELMLGLEGFDPAQDVDPGPEPSSSASAAEITASALALRARIGEARRQYQALVGEILCDLEHG